MELHARQLAVAVLERRDGGAVVTAVTVKPSGARCTESPCDIHTDWSTGSPANSADPGSVT
jgi:hypothetical protein